jgi:peroxiredoxin
LALAACTASVRAADDMLQAQLAAIEAAQMAARDCFRNELQQVERTEAAQKLPTDRFLKELDKNVEAALGIARANSGRPTAFEALKFVIRTNGSGPGDGTARALRLILDHGDDCRPGQGSYLAHMALRLWQYPDAETVLRGVLTKNPNRDDRAAACYWLARYLQEQSRLVRRLREKPGDKKYFDDHKAAAPVDSLVREKDSDALDREATTLLERAVAEFGDVRLTDYKRTISEFVIGELFAARNLDISQPAPDIAGADHEGKTFKLSDHRGKVVVLTFSGNWCGPCVQMYPEERSLLVKLKDQPFAVVSVNTDAEVKTLKEAIASGQITWRCWWDGGTDGPITTRWGVTSFPAIFVLDRQGVIRFKNVRSDDLERAVSTLLDMPESSAAPR